MNDLLILCYHAVSEDWPTDFAVSPRRLGAQLRELTSRGYRAATLSAALERPPAAKTLVVTFDDAYASVLERALPVMKGLGVPGTMYVPTGYVSGEDALEWDSMQHWLDTPHRDELRCMSWDGVRELAAAGWEIGSHSVSHPDLRSLGDAELGEELSGSKRRCEEELQRPCRSLAYPFSAHDGRVMEAARAAGYESAVILDNELAIPAGSLVRPGTRVERLGLLREGVYRHDTTLRLRLKTSPLLRRSRASKLARIARRVR
ncbi:MAG TPA: polysaccharide deacetylase family protein [Solirubrobacterales bacterium]|nr:polysaccharide deacetylase family protein [Solirubrobacterales bacterium]